MTAESWQTMWNAMFFQQDALARMGHRWLEQAPTSWRRYRKAVEILSQAEPPTGQTPKTTIWRKNKMRLYHFSLPGVERVHQFPVLMVYAMINKPYILDMEPGHSFVEFLVQQGFSVYMIDWGVAGPEDRHNGFGEYMFDYLDKAVDRVLRHAGADRIHMFAYCMGGTMGAMYTALFPDKVKDLTLLAAPIDFRHAPLYNQWLRKEYFDVDKLVETFGNVPPEVIDFGNKMLKPMSNFVDPWVSLLDRVDDETFVHSWRMLNKWVNDGTPFPGQAYREWIHEFYQDNKLVEGTLILRDRPVDLSQIRCPVLLLTAERDHIVPPPQSEALFEHILSSDRTEYQFPVGHVSLVYGGTASKRVYPRTADWLKAHDSM
ncbi:MAG TPA: class III poly(R)-hydroxyalkanoic acid synthase subunit PhaC [Alicyclobacillus sp.]|nr:class III poly(R)-hydroxyalkanoic acid synthase subunit PhaC [Alicyclobacillus sp.]